MIIIIASNEVPPPQKKTPLKSSNPPCWLSLTVKLLLTFLVLDSATLASDRSTSSKIRDWRGKVHAETKAEVGVGSETEKGPEDWAFRLIEL